MESASNIAFKEWAVVCAALAAGRQTIILRKGGIDEGREGFRVAHHEFWLLPTRFHQDMSQLASDAETFWRQIRDQPTTGNYRVGLYAVVQKVFEVHDLVALQRLTSEHILSKETVEQRYHYRHPGLFVLAVRIYRVLGPHEVSDTAYIAGCRSWVELPEPLPTAGATPVLDDPTFAARMNDLANNLRS